LDNPRFIIADALVSQSLDRYCIIMLGDLGYWTDNYEALQKWCEDHGGSVEGMTVNIPDDHTLTAFCLRWS
jgi:hypothetical protein